MFVGLRVVARLFGRMRCWTMADTLWAGIDAMAIPSMQNLKTSRGGHWCCEFFNYLKACFHFYQESPTSIQYKNFRRIQQFSLTLRFLAATRVFRITCELLHWKKITNWRSKGRRGDACITRRNQQRAERLRVFPGCWIRFRIRMGTPQAEKSRNLQDEGDSQAATITTSVTVAYG